MLRGLKFTIRLFACPVLAPVATVTPPCVSKVASAKHSPVCRDMISFPLLVTLFKRGVRPYRARQMASRMVVLPAPVGPVMAKMPSDAKAGCVRSISHSPTNEFRFLNRTCSILIDSLSIPPASHLHRETKAFPGRREAVPAADPQARHERRGIVRTRRSRSDHPAFPLHGFVPARGR